MKRQFQHPAPSERALSGPRYWRSLDELAATGPTPGGGVTRLAYSTADCAGRDLVAAELLQMGGAGLQGPHKMEGLARAGVTGSACAVRRC